jgi:hypothetical protein
MNRREACRDRQTSRIRARNKKRETTMKMLISAAMIAMFAVAALTTTEASARGIPLTAHRCKIPHFTKSGIVFYTVGICR